MNQQTIHIPHCDRSWQQEYIDTEAARPKQDLIWNISNEMHRLVPGQAILDADNKRELNS